MIVDFSDCLEPRVGCIVRFHWTKHLDHVPMKCIGQYRTICFALSSDQISLYRLVSEMTGTITNIPMPIGAGGSDVADNSADHFMNKIWKIRQILNYSQKMSRVLTSFTT